MSQEVSENKDSSSLDPVKEFLEKLHPLAEVSRLNEREWEVIEEVEDDYFRELVRVYELRENQLFLISEFEE